MADTKKFKVLVEYADDDGVHAVDTVVELTKEEAAALGNKVVSVDGERA